MKRFFIRLSSVAVALLGLNATQPALAQDFLIKSDVDLSQLKGNEIDPAIVICPLNTSNFNSFNIFAASLSDAAPGIFTAYTTNQGQNWVTNVIATNYNDTGFDAGGLPAAFGEPSVTWDTYGNLFLAYEPYTQEGVAVVVSTNGGQTFTLLTNLFSGHATDQPRITSAALGGGTGALWIVYKDYSLANFPLVAQGLQSTGLGSNGSFGPVKSIPGSTDNGGFPDIAVGPAGQVMVAFQNNAESSGASTVFVSVNTNAFGTNAFGTAVAATTDAIGGFTYIEAEQTGIGVNAAPGLAWDNNTNSTYSGRAYLVYTATGPNGNLIIGTRNSTNNGASWRSESQVDDDTSGFNDHFFPRIAVDAASGVLAYSWFDCRNDLGASSQVVTYTANGNYTFLNFVVTNVTVKVTTTPTNNTIASTATDLSNGGGTNYSVTITGDDVYGVQLGKSANGPTTNIISIYNSTAAGGTNIVIYFTGTNTSGPPTTNTTVSLSFTDTFPDAYTQGTANEEAQLYTTVSLNGGATIQPNQPMISPNTIINSPAVGFASSVYSSSSLIGFGHYTGLAFSEGHFFPAWPDNSDITTNNPEGTANFDVCTGNVFVPTSDLSVSLTSSPNPVISGGVIVFSMVVSNNGPFPATNVIVTNSFSVNLTFEHATPSLGGIYTYNSNTDTLIFSWPGRTLAAQSSVTNTITFEATSSDLAMDFASVWSPLPDTIPANNSIESNVPIEGEDLALAMAASITNANLGTPILYTLTVTNLGPAANGIVYVTNTLTTNLSQITNVIQSQGSYSISSNTIVFNLGTMASNQVVTITYDATPISLGTNFTKVTNSAFVASFDYDPNLLNNYATNTITLHGEDLAIGLSASPAIGWTNYPVTYTDTVTNIGPSTNGMIYVTNTLSTNLTNITIVQFAGSSVTNGNTVVFGAFTLNSGQITNIIFTATPTSIGTATNLAAVGSGDFDTNLLNNTNQITMPLTAPPPPFGNFSVSAFASSAFIDWTTPTNATVQVAYGLTTNYGSMSSLSGPSTNHVIMLTGLVRNTNYYFEALAAEVGILYKTNGSFFTSNTLILNTGDAAYTGPTWADGPGAVTNYYGSYFNVANTTQGNPTSWATYTPVIPTPGLYNVYTWYPTNINFSTNTQMYVSGATNTLIESINQTTNGGSWQPLATNLYFAMGAGDGTNNNIIIYNDTGEANKLIAANAMMWTYDSNQDYTMGAAPAWWSTFWAAYLGTNTAATTSNYYAYVFGVPPDNTNAFSFLVSFPTTNTIMAVFSPVQGGRTYQLQSSTNLFNSQSWSNLTLTPPTISTNAFGLFTNGTGYGIFVTNFANSGQTFFRLSVGLTTNY